MKADTQGRDDLERTKTNSKRKTEMEKVRDRHLLNTGRGEVDVDGENSDVLGHFSGEVCFSVEQNPKDRKHGKCLPLSLCSQQLQRARDSRERESPRNSQGK